MPDSRSAGRIRRCPGCGHDTQWEDNPWRPFCSERCKLIDLGAWTAGDYAVPGEPAPPEALMQGEASDRDSGA